jgi:hypothetical protein
VPAQDALKAWEGLLPLPRFIATAVGCKVFRLKAHATAADALNVESWEEMEEYRGSLGAMWDVTLGRDLKRAALAEHRHDAQVRARGHVAAGRGRARLDDGSGALGWHQQGRVCGVQAGFVAACSIVRHCS